MNRNLQIGVLLLNTFVLSLEIAITRIFSVTMFYHFAFLAISVALFGFGASGVVLYIWNKKFEGGNLGKRLGDFALWAGLLSIAAAGIALSIDFNPHGSLGGMQAVKLLVIYLSTSVPFFFAGLVLAHVFQRVSKHIARLYFLSLVGSALGAVIVIPLLQIAGGPGAIIIIASFAFFAMAGFNQSGDIEGNVEVKPGNPGLVPLLVAIMLVVVGLLNPQLGILKVTHAKGHTIDTDKIIFDQWNAFSRIIVIHQDDALGYYPRAGTEASDNEVIQRWGISAQWDLEEHPLPSQHWLEIDNTAGTPITNFNGDLSELEIAKYDITAAAHYLLEDAHVLVVGPGGGKDLLAALAFEASDIDAAEINPLIGEVMRERFADFNGGLYDFDPIHVTVSEGRTFIARSQEQYDLIQISLIDTWAAASTGAYALSENNLYTVEAFKEYYDHLAPDGIFSMSRFWFDSPPRETLKVVSVARAALEDRGVEDVSRCVMVIAQGVIANVIVRPDGFDDEALASMMGVIEDLGYTILYMPGREPRGELEAPYIYHDLLTTSNFQNFLDQYELDIRPTTDDRPFFFYLLPPWEFMKALSFGKTYRAGYNSIAIFTLVTLFLISIAVTLIFIVLPLLLFRRRDIRERRAPKIRTLWYFVCLGLAFIMVEIALMQHFTLFLGYPVYSLVAVLMSLLLFSGFGSGWSGRIPEQGLEIGIRNAVVGISVVAVIYIFILPPIFSALIALPDLTRILITIVVVFPLGWFMGQPFPLGLRLIEREGLGIIPWAWGVNGAASVLGSALALTVAIGIGYKLTLFFGVTVYLIGSLIILTVRKLRAGKSDECHPM